MTTVDRLGNMTNKGSLTIDGGATYSNGTGNLTVGGSLTANGVNVNANLVVSGTETAKISAETIASGQSSGNDPNIYFSSGTIFKLLLTNSPILTFSGATKGETLTLFLTQDGGANRTIAAWPTVKWPGGVAPTLTPTAGKTDIITLFYDGTDYYGFTGGLNY